MNITLSIDEKLAEQARKIAQSMGKSLNQLVRDYLEQLTRQNEAQEEIAELRRLSTEGQGHSQGWRFARDELHERS
jgi:Ribbon-helix-helix protein, copG family.